MHQRLVALIVPCPSLRLAAHATRYADTTPVSLRYSFGREPDLRGVE
jgi:hypothetical protein